MGRGVPACPDPAVLGLGCRAAVLANTGPRTVRARDIPGCLSQAVSVTLRHDPEQGVQGQGIKVGGRLLIRERSRCP